MVISTIELFAGVGMLGEGLRAGLAHLGIQARTVCYVEREAHAAAVLAARIEEGSLDPAPIWSDVLTFPARQFHGKVDCIVAGFPCQDISVAGQRKGLDGHRSGLFFEIPRIADACGAWSMLLENVAGIASATASVMDEAEGELDERAAARVVGELADLGWDAEWLTLPASDVGASHRRARWFCFAWRMDDAVRTERWPRNFSGTDRQQGNNAGWTETHGRIGIAEQALVDAARHGWSGLERQARDGRRVREASNTMDDTHGTGTQRPGRTQQGADSECEELDNTISIGRRTRRNADAQHERHVFNAASKYAVANTSSARCSERQDTGASSTRHDTDGRTDGRTDARTMPINYPTSSC